MAVRPVQSKIEKVPDFVHMNDLACESTGAKVSFHWHFWLREGLWEEQNRITVHFIYVEAVVPISYSDFTGAVWQGIDAELGTVAII